MPLYEHHFSNRNIPFGIATSRNHREPQGATRLGNHVVFLGDCQKAGLFNGIGELPAGSFARDALNDFASLPKHVHREVRLVIQQVHGDCDGRLNTSGFPAQSIEHISSVTTRMPVRVGDFVDFSCSLEHVKNAGRIVIDDERPPPAFFNLPIGYQGRASSILVSNTDIQRPLGQFRDKATPSTGDGQPPIVYGPSRAVDYELEFAAIIGKPLPANRRLNATEADEHIFGFVVLNDWSARDIQGYEMIPLGPLNGKNFGTSISPWVVTLDALAPFEAAGQKPVAPIPPYLRDPANVTYAVRMQVEILPGGSESASTVMGRSEVQSLHWSVRQMIAHVASAGSSLRTGDVMATGTVSGPAEGQLGSLLEVSEGGTRPYKLKDGSERRFLLDGDVVRMTAVAGSEGSGVGFGGCIGRLVASPAI